MKKVFCLLIVLMATRLVFGASQDLLTSYFEDASFENLKAVLEDANSSKDLASSNYNLLMVHYSEMNKTLAKLEEIADDLQAAQRFQLANIYLTIGRLEESLPHYNYLNDKFANWSCPWRHKGEVYYKLGNWVKAEEAFTKAIETREEHYDAYMWLARAQLKLKKNKEALKTFETAMFYKGKDIEDPEEEFSSHEENFLKLEILQANKMKKEYKKLAKELKEKYPQDKYWEK